MRPSELESSSKWYLATSKRNHYFEAYGLSFNNVHVDDQANPFTYFRYVTEYNRKRKVNPIRVFGRAYRRSKDVYDMVMVVIYKGGLKIRGNSYFRIGSSIPKIWYKNADQEWFNAIIRLNSERAKFPAWTGYPIVEGESDIVILPGDNKFPEQDLFGDLSHISDLSSSNDDHGSTPIDDRRSIIVPISDFDHIFDLYLKKPEKKTPPPKKNVKFSIPSPERKEESEGIQLPDPSDSDNPDEDEIEQSEIDSPCSDETPDGLPRSRDRSYDGMRGNEANIPSPIQEPSKSPKSKKKKSPRMPRDPSPKKKEKKSESPARTDNSDRSKSPSSRRSSSQKTRSPDRSERINSPEEPQSIPENVRSPESVILLAVNGKPVEVNESIDELPNCRIDKKSGKSIANTNIVERSNFKFSQNVKNCIRSNLHRILYGPRDVGKTSLAKYMLKHKCIVVERMEDLVQYDPSRHNGIIFENIDFSNVEHYVILTLLENINRIVKTVKGDVLLPYNVRLIFTTNMERGKIFGTKPSDKHLYNECSFLNVNKQAYIYVDENSESDEHPVAYP